MDRGGQASGLHVAEAGAQQPFDFRLTVKLRPYTNIGADGYLAATLTEAWVFSQAKLRVQPVPA